MKKITQAYITSCEYEKLADFKTFSVYIEGVPLDEKHEHYYKDWFGMNFNYPNYVLNKNYCHSDLDNYVGLYRFKTNEPYKLLNKWYWDCTFKYLVSNESEYNHMKEIWMIDKNITICLDEQGVPYIEEIKNKLLELKNNTEKNKTMTNKKLNLVIKKYDKKVSNDKLIFDIFVDYPKDIGFTPGFYPSYLEQKDVCSQYLYLYGLDTNLSNDSVDSGIIRMSYIIPKNIFVGFEDFIKNRMGVTVTSETKASGKTYLYAEDLYKKLKELTEDYALNSKVSQNKEPNNTSPDPILDDIDAILDDIDAVNNLLPKIKKNKPLNPSTPLTPDGEIDIHAIVYGKNKSDEKVEVKYPNPRVHLSGIDRVSIRFKEENVFRKNGSIEKTNQFLQARYDVKKHTGNMKSDDFEVFKDINKSSIAYERLLIKIIDRILLTDERMIEISNDKTTMDLLGNPTPDEVMTVMNNLIKTDNSNLCIEHKSATNYNQYQIVEPVIYNKSITPSYYEDIEGIILANQEGHNPVPDMMDAFYKIMKG